MKYVILIGLILTLSSCQSQTKESQKPKAVRHNDLIKNHSYNQLLKNKKMDHFDIKKFNSHKDEGENYLYKTEDGAEVEEFGDEDKGYFRNLTPKNSLYTLYEEFYPTGVLKTNGQTFRNSGCQLGVWKEYNQKGESIKTTDTDKPFTITFEDIIKFCQEKKADLQATTTTIDRYYDEQTNVCTWTIGYVGEYDGNKGMYILEIGGKSGDMIKVVQVLGKEGEHKVLYDKGISGDKKTGVYKKPENDKNKNEQNKGFWSSLVDG